MTATEIQERQIKKSTLYHRSLQVTRTFLFFGLAMIFILPVNLLQIFSYVELYSYKRPALSLIHSGRIAETNYRGVFSLSP